jgi:hypothetical protein
MTRHAAALAIFILLLSSVSGCAKTQVTSIANPSAPRYGPRQVLVVAAYADLEWRRDVEMSFYHRHPAFIPSVYTIDVDALTSVEAIIRHMASDSTIEALLVLSPTGAGIAESLVASQHYVARISKPWTNTTVTIYDKELRRIVWRADASTVGNAMASWSDLRGSFVGGIVGRLARDRLLSSTERLIRAETSGSAHTAFAPGVWRSRVPSDSEIIMLTLDNLYPSSGASVYEQNTPAIIALEGNSSSGAAFVISREGLALTNHHVVAGQSNLIARFSNGNVSPARVIRSDEPSDVALVEIQCPVGCHTVILSSAEDIAPGSEILAIGHPVGLQHTLTSGIVSAVRRARGVMLIQVDAALNEGNSGGPILERNSGAVVGIVSFKISGMEGLGFAVAVDDALRVLGVRYR